MQIPGLIVLLLLFPPLSGAATASSDYEQELVYGLQQQLEPAEFVWLQAEGASFAGLYRPAMDTNARAVVLLHGMGAHADRPGIINSVRTRLPTLGWSTLSIQLPVLPPHQSLSDYGTLVTRSVARVRAAISHLQQAGYAEIALVGHGFGASIAVMYLAGEPRHVGALAAISLQEFPFLDPPLKLVDQLAKLKLPVLDIYAAQDFSDVLRTVDDRRLGAVRAANPEYLQQVVPDADHDFTTRRDELIDRIVRWLDGIIPVHRQTDIFIL